MNSPKHKWHDRPNRPAWWPENEPWPPAGPPGKFRRRHFTRRVGCFFSLFSLLAFVFLLLFFALAVSWLARLPAFRGEMGWAVALGLAFLFGGFAFLLWAARGLRRASIPVSDLLEAADRVAEGDFSARAREQGPGEVRAVARAFNTMAERLQIQDTQRRNLLADVTHELRTPLTVIQGILEALLDGVYPADEANLRSLLDETQMLSRLVDDLRMLTLAESGALQLRKEPTDLAALIQETASAFQVQAQTAIIRIKVIAEPQVPWLNVDPERIRQVLVNLLNNALRYTPPEGTIQIRYWVKTENGDRQAAIEVTDSGVGIQPEDLAHIFDRFYKSRDSGGMGLGLAIAKSLVGAHGGTIRALSTPGKGTTISIFLPLSA